MKLEDRFTGALLGLAVGDALGGPLSFMSSQQIQIKHGWVTEMIGGGWLDLRAGESTDETKLMTHLAESLIQKKDFDRLDVALRYVQLAESQARDMDNITRSALAEIGAGTPVQDAARLARELTAEEEVTNGALVRSVPLGLFYFRDRERLIRASRSEAAITHDGMESISGAPILNLFLARILEGVSGFDLLFDEVEVVVKEAEGIRDLISGIRKTEEGELRPTGSVEDTLEVALWDFYWGDSFETSVVRGVNRGGPTDTVGAVVGALAGAFHGVSSIPDRWLRVLENRNRIEQIALDLHRLAIGSAETRP